MDIAAENIQDRQQKRCGTMEIAVLGTIDRNVRRRITALMVEVDTSLPRASVAARRRKGRAGGSGDT